MRFTVASLLAILLALTALPSCADPGDVVILGPDHRLEPSENETQLPTNQEYIDAYNLCCNRFPDIQIPLYRIIDGGDYRYFLGIPMDANPHLIASLFESVEDAEFHIQDRSDDLWLIAGQDEENCYSIFLFTLPGDHLFMISLVSEDKSMCGQYLNSEWLFDRIQKMKN